MYRDLQPKAIALLELAAAAVVISFDLLIPTLVIAAWVIFSVLLGRIRLLDLGFKKISPKMVATVGLLAIVWTLADIGLIIPVLNHITGTTQDVSAFVGLRGNAGRLLYLLALSWTLAAIGEETVYRGFVQERILGIIPHKKTGFILAVGVSSVLFGLAHTEQGPVGVAVAAVDAVFFSLVKWRYDNNIWAAVFAHGFCNTIGMAAFFIAGPIPGLW